ncbi:MAG: hypothetical protein AAF680_08515 [Pseudomonadota bacterium]
MKFSHFASLLLLLSAICSQQTAALTTDQFFSICEAAKVTCSEHPILQAYIGGSLDFTAALSEETDYLSEPFCKDPKELFKTTPIIEFMQEHRDEYSDKNAMLLVVRYFEVRGGC